MIYHIIGQGLAGTCLAWRLWEKGASFSINDDDRHSSSRPAAGVINPITGQNFEPSWRAQCYIPEAIAFYQTLEKKFSQRFWHPLAIQRLVSTEKEWLKIQSKWDLPDIAAWQREIVPAPKPFIGSVMIYGGGRLDTNLFLDESRRFFQSIGAWKTTADPHAITIWCDGAAGILQGNYGDHRCAKGEILTIETNDSLAPQWIVTGMGGWLVPMGNGIYKVGATYEWKELNVEKTSAALERLTEIAKSLGVRDFEIINHQAGIRPILRRSQPLIGPMSTNEWMMNGLGSKGSLCAPSVALQLANWLCNGIEADEELDLRKFNGKAI